MTRFQVHTFKKPRMPMPDSFGPRYPARCSSVTEKSHVQASQPRNGVKASRWTMGGTRSATSGYPWQRRVHERKSTRDTARMQTALAAVQEFVHCLGVVPRGMCNQGSRTGYGKRERLALTGPGVQVSDRACFKDHLTCNGYLCSRRLWCLQMTRKLCMCDVRCVEPSREPVLLKPQQPCAVTSIALPVVQCRTAQYL